MIQEAVALGISVFLCGLLGIFLVQSFLEKRRIDKVIDEIDEEIKRIKLKKSSVVHPWELD